MKEKREKSSEKLTRNMKDNGSKKLWLLDSNW